MWPNPGWYHIYQNNWHINGEVPDCSVSTSDALDIPQPCTKSLILPHYELILSLQVVDLGVSIVLEKFDGSAQDCGKSIANGTKPFNWPYYKKIDWI